MFDVISVGSGLVDAYLRSSDFRVVKGGGVPGGTAICEVYGAKIEIDDLEVTTGGGGTNTAVSFARKGLRTATVIRVGDDLVGLLVCDELSKESVALDFVQKDKRKRTGFSTILVANDGGRTVMVYRGASIDIEDNEIDWKRLRSRWLHVTSIGGDMVLLKRLLNHARRNNILVALNPGKRELKKRDELLKLLSEVEVLFLNRDEASMLFKKDFFDKRIWSENRGDFLKNQKVFVTAGREGGKVYFDGGVEFYEARSKKVVEETGAGDAFGSGVVAGLAYEKDLVEAIEWGVENAASVVSLVGPKKGLLSLREIKSLVREGGEVE